MSYTVFFQCLTSGVLYFTFWIQLNIQLYTNCLTEAIVEISSPFPKIYIIPIITIK